MKKILSVALLSLVGYLGACQDANGVSQAGQVRETISTDQFEKKLAETPGAQLVDVRTAEEYADGHLKGAVNMNVNREDYKEQFNTLDKTRPVFVYCLSGRRSGNASKIMQKMGFKEIYNMDGGITKWSNAGKPLESGSPAGSR